MIKQLLAVWPLIQKGFWVLSRMALKRLKANFRGSFKDPLLYLRAAALILFVLVSFGTSASLGASPNESFYPQPIISQGADKIFLEQEKAQKFNFSFFNVLQGNSLVGICVPTSISPQVLGILGGEISDQEVPETRNEIIEYTVQSGDTLDSLAERFNVSLNTILWANDLSKNSKLKIGQSLVILPTSGLIHYVKKGETLSQIAERYKGNVGEIVVFNDISGQEIFVGDILIIPGGIISSTPKKVAKTPTTSSFSVPNTPLANSYFIFPTQGKISQGLHWYNAVDIATPCGTPVYAAAQGTILKTKFSNSGLGNYIAVSHPNGTITYYGHLQNILVGPGEQVSQGQIIALIGGRPGMAGAGNSTGCHVHFEVRGAQNPFAR
ncbi:MAG: hypothetical protein A2Z78_01960 [Candidatus Nealsonbacteria bacterium RBG_13_36_15]|uniref:LysM domain-containing protein n=1 Tax=Candidatus Nealsonbacteria bacterium RBG_13_36_15 TaxID=1801660 RepID=A0A1G2DVJ3_9BACT|nr:MAG: hypothetical protein A2Z78_01960 [Candidatus Nealsonbacteria bacterium RBG_13_36_15]